MPAVRIALLASLLAGSLAAQQYVPKESLVGDFRRQKDVVLKFVEAMPDSALGFRPEPGSRSFAEQIEHLVVSDVELGSDALGRRPPALGDKTQYLVSKPALREFVVRGFDYTIGLVGALEPAEMTHLVEMMGDRLPVWKWFEVLREHGTWTLGATVPYLRHCGVVPPAYLSF